MATYVNDLRLKEIGTGESSGTWGTETNVNLELIGEALGYGTEGITTNADTHTTTVADGSTDPGRAMYIEYTGTLDSACTVTIAPNTLSRLHYIENGTSGSQNIIIKQGSGATVTIPPGDTKAVYLDGAGSGAKVVDVFASFSVVDLKVQDDLTVTDDATVGGTLGVTGILTCTDDIIIGDGKTIGSASDVDAMTIASNGQVTFTQTLIGTALDISGDIDVDGTANLDIVDIDGATNIAAAVTMATNNKIQFRDDAIHISSTADGQLDLVADTEIQIAATTIDINGAINASGEIIAASLDISGNIDVDGTTNLDVVDIDGAVDMASTLQVDGAATFSSSVTSLQNIVTQTGGDFAATFTTPFDFVAKFESTDGSAFIVLEDNGSTNNANRIGAVGDSIQIESGAVENVIFTSTASVFNEGSVDMDFRVESNGNANMLFVDGGNDRVGVGTSSPDFVFQTSAANAQIGIEATTSGQNASLYYTANGANQWEVGVNIASGLSYEIYDRVNNGSYLTVDHSGNVTVKVGALQLSDVAQSIDFLQSGAINFDANGDQTGRVLTIGSNRANGASGGITNVTFDETGGTVFNEGGVDADFRIESDGNVNMFHVDGGNNSVGVGITGQSGVQFYCDAPGSMHAAVFRNDDAGFAPIISDNQGGSGTRFFMSFRLDNTEVGKITSTGSATVYATSSDYRLKENVDYTWDATTRLKQLKPARFNFIADETNTLVDGFLAHEVSSIVPEAVSGEKDAVDADGNPDHQGIDQSKLVPLLVKTIQELEARITALES